MFTFYYSISKANNINLLKNKEFLVTSEFYLTIFSEGKVFIYSICNNLAKQFLNKIHYH